MKKYYWIIGFLFFVLCGKAEDYRISDDGQNIVTQKDTIFKLSKFSDFKIKKIDSFFFDSEKNRILFATETETDIFGYTSAEHYVFFILGNRVEKVSEYGKQQIPAFSPNGRMVAFVRNNNIFIKKFDYGTEITISEDGSDNILNGLPDWNYKKYLGAERLFDWSPDGKMLYFVRTDNSAVRDYCIDIYPSFDKNSFNPAEFYPQKRCYKYPLAGSENPKVSLQVYDVQYRSIKELNVSADEDFYILRTDWLPSSGNLAVVTLNRLQNLLNLQFINPKSNVSKNILKENLNTPLDINNVRNLKFLPDDQFIWINQNGDQLLYSGTGILKKQTASKPKPMVTIFRTPQNFDENEKYPLVFVTGTIDSSLVNMLVENGYAVGGYDFSDATVEKQLDLVRELSKKDYIDNLRIFVLGYGENATTALLAMSLGENVFKAGIAIAPITDWRFDNSFRAERLLGSPQENFKAYIQNSPLEQAENLRGKVLLIHGTADDDVHLQNTFAYADRLTKFSKAFEMQIYQNVGHDIPKEILYKRILEFLAEF